jgi:hypothetical protein
MQDSRKRYVKLVVVLLSVLFINAGQNPPSPVYTPAVIPPPPSIIIRDVSLVQGGTATQPGSYMYPYIPSFRTSADGRIAIPVRELGAGGGVNFYLFVPEAINQQTPPLPFRLTAKATPPTILPSTSVMQHLTLSQLGLDTAISNGYSPQHNTICDPTVQDLNNPPPSPNPYTCPAPNSADDDCYTLFIISPMSNGTNLVIYSTPVVVEVAQPKQIGAHIIKLTPQLPAAFTPTPIPIANKNNPSQSNLLEPMITTDGHLLVGRIQESTLTWTNNSGTTVTGKYNIVYSAGSATGYAPCDVKQWTNFYPIAHAYNDPNMNAGRYGVADYQFRDPENNPIPETADIEGNYPWIDRMGRNLFFTHVVAMLFNQDNSTTGVMARYADGYTNGCLALNNCNPDPLCSTTTTCETPISSLEEKSNTRGLTVAGRWTHGKMVQLDGLVNNIDFGLRVPDADQRMITLYSSGNPIQFGSGRQNDAKGNPPDYPENITITDSFENIFNYVATLKPITLREVTWQINMGKGGDEIPFDDYLNPDAFIVSDMTASTSWATYNYPQGINNYSSSATPIAGNYADGFTAPPNGGFNAQIHLQNSATPVSSAISGSSRWNIPIYGLVKGSTGNMTGMSARIEPAALGGIKGKGFWLQKGNYVSYAIPSQHQSVMQTPWFISMFVDSRCCGANGDTTHRRILTFPDGSYLNIVGSSALEVGYQVQGTTTTISGTLPLALNLPIPQGWWHIAFQVLPNTQNGGQTDTLNVYVNGYLLKTYQTNAPIFQILPPPPGTCPAGGCQVTLGGDPNPSDNVTGFTGWVDEFKVIAQNVDYETACNHAHGTIAGSNSSWGDVTSYPQTGTTSETTLINQLTHQNLNYYGCVVNYSSDANATYLPAFTITGGNLPLGTTSMRDALHFPEAKLLHWNQLRPDSTQNTFCGSCHTDNGGQASQTLSNACALGQLTQALIDQCRLIAQPTTMMWQDPRRQPMNPQRLVYGNVPNSPVPYFNGQQPTQQQPITGAGISLDQWVFP